jgi:hypothetical protein
LTRIFNNPNWGTTNVLQMAPLFNQLQEGPLFKLHQQVKSNNRRSRYPYGEVIIEWKQKKRY